MAAKFLVLSDFIIRRTHDGVVLNTGDAPILGMYWKDHQYAVTPLNAPAVDEAVKQKLAVITGVGT